jgi:integrase
MTSPHTAQIAQYPCAPMSLEEAEWVWRELRTAVGAADATPETVRLAVIVGLSRATGARYGDLLRCTVDDVDAHRGSVRVRRGTHRIEAIHDIDTNTARVLNLWCAVRRGLCADLEGAPPRALLLTVHHTHDNGVTVAAGLPITRQGLVLSWRRFVQRSNARHAGLRQPIPTRFEQMRRAWWPDGAAVGP